jgi:hypothetical protein
VLGGCQDVIKQILRSSIEARTRDEFTRVVQGSFPKYAKLTMAVSQLATALIEKPVIEQLVRESICEMEADFRDGGMAAFGAVVRDQSIFTIWTLRKINEITEQIIAVPVAAENKTEDEEICGNFNFFALRAHFSLDCLNMALTEKHAVYPEVLEELVDGLRSMVNAYAFARRGLDLRNPAKQAPAHLLANDAEDEALMDFSFFEASEWLDNEEGVDAIK